jgi:hypothetical protein
MINYKKISKNVAVLALTGRVTALEAALRTVQSQIEPGAHPADIKGALITIRAALAGCALCALLAQGARGE